MERQRRATRTADVCLPVDDLGKSRCPGSLRVERSVSDRHFSLVTHTFSPRWCSSETAIFCAASRDSYRTDPHSVRRIGIAGRRIHQIRRHSAILQLLDRLLGTQRIVQRRDLDCELAKHARDISSHGRAGGRRRRHGRSRVPWRRRRRGPRASPCNGTRSRRRVRGRGTAATRREHFANLGSFLDRDDKCDVRRECVARENRLHLRITGNHRAVGQ